MKNILITLLIAFAVVGLYRLSDQTHEPQDESATSTATSTADYPENYTAYASSDDFIVGYPAETFSIVADGEEVPDAYESYIPACGSRGYQACIFYIADDLRDTNFGAAGVAVRTRADFVDQASCESTAGNYPTVENDRAEEVNGQDFFVFETGEGAVSHRSEAVVYRTFQESVCWELEARIGSSVYEVYEEGAVERFTEEDRAALRDQLNEIVNTFALK